MINLCTYSHAFLSPKELFAKHLPDFHFLGPQPNSISGQSQGSLTLLKFKFSPLVEWEPKIFIKLSYREKNVTFTSIFNYEYV
jgi:hypothetical protein